MSTEPPKKKQGFFKRYANRIRTYAEITEVGEIARRYFIMNAFDGALTTLGFIIGFFIAGVTDPSIVIVAVLAGALAMGISGLWGAYLAESAERKRELKQLERSMMTDLSHSIQARASRFAIIFSALIDGLSPALASIIGILPFFFGVGGGAQFNILFYISISINLTMLFFLGMFLGRISKENVVWMGVKVLLAGVLITLILWLVNLGH
ncbi:MAG TPA: VIT1/CCC1 transporter family protein [Candidatus Deferrimicrobium sp.]|nr:VIT1/CCC1 transporter family protein [Candidatus Deferrimicrobium sp.]